MKRIQDRGLTILFTAFAAVLSAASAFLILKRTVAGSVLADPGTKMMVLELAVLLIWLFIAFYFFRGSNVSLVLCVVVPYVFLWLHRIALPVLAAGAYAAYLILLGELWGTVCGGRKENDRIMGYAHDFVLGSSLQIVIVCMFSAFGIGGAVFFRRQVIVTAVIAGIALYLLKAGAWLTGNAVELLPDEGELKKEEKYRALISAALAVIFTFLLMQAARINIAADYDSLHYGLRSQYVLDNGHGIYENLGSINDVYFYPKGLEILTLPLSNRISFGFVTAFSWWMTAGSLVMIFRAVCLRTKRRFGVYAATAACLIPGIMNMAASAKTDAVTLFIQLIAVNDFMSGDAGRSCGGRTGSDGKRYGGTENGGFLCGIAAAVLSLCFKPTSWLFSFILVVCAVLRQIVTAAVTAGNKEVFFASLKKIVRSGRNRYGAVLFPAATLAAFGVTMRTILLTGVPLTTAGLGFWKLFGFRLKYPLAGPSVFAGSGAPFSGALGLVKRLAGVFGCPVGDDMLHVYIAWGGLTVTLCLLSWGIRLLGKPRLLGLYHHMALFAVSLVSVFCIASLWQVDGNYFCLLYALAVTAAFSLSEENCRIGKALIPAMLLGAFMCCVTNWAGARGLTPVKFLHAGYYDSEWDNYDESFADGNEKIYDYLAKEEHARVIAFADQPECFDFMCVVQSYTDIEGSGGNVAVVKTLDGFKDFLDYAGTDYIYTEEAFLAPRDRASDIIRYMQEDGSIVPVIAQGDKVLYRYERR